MTAGDRRRDYGQSTPLFVRAPADKPELGIDEEYCPIICQGERKVIFKAIVKSFLALLDLRALIAEARGKSRKHREIGLLDAQLN